MFLGRQLLGGRPADSQGHLSLETELVAHLEACKVSHTQLLALVCLESVSSGAGYRKNRALLEEFRTSAYQKQNRTRNKVTLLKF